MPNLPNTPHPTVNQLARDGSLADNAPVFSTYQESVDDPMVTYCLDLPQEMVWFWDGQPHDCVAVDMAKKRLTITAPNCHAVYAQSPQDAAVWYLVSGGIDESYELPKPVGMNRLIHQQKRQVGAFQGITGNITVKSPAGYGPPMYMRGGGGGAGSGGYMHIHADVLTGAIQAAQNPRSMPKDDPEHRFRKNDTVIHQRKAALGRMRTAREKDEAMRQWAKMDVLDEPIVKQQVEAMAEARAAVIVQERLKEVQATQTYQGSLNQMVDTDWYREVQAQYVAPKPITHNGPGGPDPSGYGGPVIPEGVTEKPEVEYSTLQRIKDWAKRQTET